MGRGRANDEESGEELKVVAESCGAGRAGNGCVKDMVM